jgi:hypothetical protein
VSREDRTVLLRYSVFACSRWRLDDLTTTTEGSLALKEDSMEFKSVQEAVEYAISRTLRIEINPCWSSFQPHSERKVVEVWMFDPAGQDSLHWVGKIAI